MDLKVSLLLACFFAGCVAFPKPEEVTVFDPQDAYLYLDTKLVGATPAPEGSAPYMVALITGTSIRSFFCGGSIISERHVLTAAHCIDAVYSSSTGLFSSLEGNVGSNTWRTGTGYPFSHNISHANYVSATIKNDIGILVTTRPIEFTSRVNLVPLDYNYIPGGVVSRVAGWGRIGQNLAVSAELLELYVSTITGQECIERVQQYSLENNVINVPPIEDPIEVCTFHSNGRGNCNGDSGSPLVGVRSRSQFGIVSWGFPCARGVPDMFVRVSGFTEWLQAALAEPADRIIS